MKFAALLITLAALAAADPGWGDTLRHNTAALNDSAPAPYRAREQQDEERYRVCDAQRADNPATRTIDFTANGRRCLIDALGQAASVQGTLVLLRNATVALYKNPTDQALRSAALQAVGRARATLAGDRLWLGDRFAEQAAALDVAEFAIHLPQLYVQQQVWRLEAFWGGGKVARKD